MLHINGTSCFLTRTGYVSLLVGSGLKLTTYLELVIGRLVFSVDMDFWLDVA